MTDPNLGDVERSFRLHIPAGYSPSNDVATPLVLDFHGMFGFGNSLRGMDDVADQVGFIFACIIIHLVRFYCNGTGGNG